MAQPLDHPMDQCLLDSHCHLDDSSFDADREQVIERARAAGLKYLLAVGGGSGPDALDASLPIAARHDGIYATVGIHPHEAARAEARHFDRLREAARLPKVLGIGEIGLDYHHDHSPREVQKKVLTQQLEIAREARLPVVIHCREAWADLREILSAGWAASGLGGILHCFTGTLEEARPFLESGFLVSFAGNLTFKKAENLREAARAIPLDRLLTETDSPYLAPAPHRGRRNEPAWVREVARELARLRSLSEEAMGALTVQNFERLFGLGHREPIAPLNA
jgi:TatD DNase family protein